MDHPVLKTVRDLLAGTYLRHAHHQAREQQSCGSLCDIWSNRRFIWPGDGSFPPSGTTISTMSFPAPTQTTLPASQRMMQTAISAAQTAETVSNPQKTIEPDPDSVRSTKSPTSTLQSDMNPPSVISAKEPPWPPLSMGQNTDIPYMPKPWKSLSTAPEWTSTSSLDPIPAPTSEPAATSTAALTSTPSALGEEAVTSGSGFSTATIIAIVVPISVTGIAIFVILLYCFLKHRHRKQRPDSTSPSFIHVVPKNPSPWDYPPTPIERTSFVTMIPPRSIPPAVRTPDTQSLNRDPVPSPSLDSRNGVQSRFTEQDHSMYAAAGMPIALTEVNVNRHEQQTPTSSHWPLSPFRDSMNPTDDDAVSEISKLSDTPGTTQNQDLDDMSSISSIDENEQRHHIQP
ncbi:hypothetical protein BDV28DRAFT_145596 [Aspergillus coremiiformis]|uniref:Mid2 domain-containing protein n=1 Tax=Aspergillus coremiiformis TaxID=138285 RepID=A0A5N6ZEY8_9EURO|nr:hypothetical protein BDV28DRAFT_145596 [Aspergillus coremiiformis]